MNTQFNLIREIAFNKELISKMTPKELESASKVMWRKRPNTYQRSLLEAISERQKKITEMKKHITTTRRVSKPFGTALHHVKAIAEVTREVFVIDNEILLDYSADLKDIASKHFNFGAFFKSRAIFENGGKDIVNHIKWSIEDDVEYFLNKMPFDDFSVSDEGDGILVEEMLYNFYGGSEEYELPSLKIPYDVMNNLCRQSSADFIEYIDGEFFYCNDYGDKSKVKEHIGIEIHKVLSKSGHLLDYYCKNCNK